MKLHDNTFRGALLIAFAAATSSASATPETLTKASCATKSADARQRTNFPAELPRIAEELQLTGRAIVQVDLSERGVVRNAAVVTSSGNALLDRAARESTLQQRYAPEVRDCTNVAGSYLVEVDFAR